MKNRLVSMFVSSLSIDIDRFSILSFFERKIESCVTGMIVENVKNREKRIEICRKKQRHIFSNVVFIVFCYFTVSISISYTYDMNLKKSSFPLRNSNNDNNVNHISAAICTCCNINKISAEQRLSVSIYKLNSFIYIFSH